MCVWVLLTDTQKWGQAMGLKEFTGRGQQSVQPEYACFLKLGETVKTVTQNVWYSTRDETGELNLENQETGRSTGTLPTSLAEVVCELAGSACQS